MFDKVTLEPLLQSSLQITPRQDDDTSVGFLPVVLLERCVSSR